MFLLLVQLESLNYGFRGQVTQGASELVAL